MSAPRPRRRRRCALLLCLATSKEPSVAFVVPPPAARQKSSLLVRRDNNGVVARDADQRQAAHSSSSSAHDQRQATSSDDDDDEAAAHELAAATLALLRGDTQTPTIKGDRRDVVRRVFGEDDEQKTNKSSLASFEALAGALVEEVAKSGKSAAVATARSLLESPEDLQKARRDIGAKLFEAANGASPRDVRLLLDAIRSSRRRHEIFPTALRSLDAVVGDLQLLPSWEEDHSSTRREDDSDVFWHARIPGDGHALRRWTGPSFSVVGIGKSADASAYYLPELGVVFDAGLAVKSLVPKTVFVSHGHRDHVQALPALARRVTYAKKENDVVVVAPKAIESLVRNFIHAEAQLNFGRAQTPDETDRALGALNLVAVEPGDSFLLPKHAHVGPPLGVDVYRARHKDGVPALSYGLYHARRKLKPEFADVKPAELKLLDRDAVTHLVKDYLIFYSGDTRAELLAEEPDVLANYKFIIHECTFVGTDLPALDAQCAATGHSHYLRLHPFILAHPDTTFILAHFSTRYSRADVLDFFYDAYGGVPHNVVLWA